MIRWGILATGTIARNFARTCRAMGDEVCLHAVASRSEESARAFAGEYGIARAYGSYEALARDPEVDIVYVATPHSRHDEDMRLLIEAGKHVLCEKSFTTDAAQAREIFALAKARGVFVMEAFWTGCIPANREMMRIVSSGALGEIRAVTAQYGYTTARQARKFDPALAGGTLLDIGVYAIGFACMALGNRFDEVRGSLVMNAQGTDAIDAIALRRGGAVAQLTTAIGAQMPVFAAVYGEKGHIDVPDFKNPQTITVHIDGQAPREIRMPFEVNGFEYEIREAQRCLRQGLLHSALVPPEQTVAVMQIMDAVRAQAGFAFPFERGL